MAGGPRYRELAPDRLPEPVRDLVECAWRAATPAGGHRQRVLPDGCMDLIMIDGRLVVAGPDTAAHETEQCPDSVLTGLRFRPGALPALLGVPADALRDQRVALADLLGAATPVARAEMRTSATSRSLDSTGAHLGGGDLPTLLGTAAALRGDARTPLDPLPRPALGALARGMPAAELADRLGVTTRTLHRRCVATLGYGPSVARRVLRFRAATALLFDGVAPSEAAARAGYADQPHLSREVRALSGLSPAALAPAEPRRPSGTAGRRDHS